MTTATPCKRKVPAQALRMTAPCQFAAASADGRKAPITILARSAEPLDHWFWGRCVHDMAGMSLRKDRCPLDYEHSSFEIIGYANQFHASNDGLTVSGELISFREDDMAAEVMFKGQQGVPYEASIDFDPGKLIIEEISEGFTAFVNGQQMEGPLTIFREWELRGVAIARYGADSNARTSFTEQEQIEVEVTITESETMPESKKPEAEKTPEPKTPETPPVAEAVTAPDEATAFSKAQEHVKAELTKFTATFGHELGVTYFSEGKPFAEACTLFIQHQAGEIAKRDERITKLNQQLASIDTGEKTPTEFSSDEPKDESQSSVATQFSHLPKGLGKFASGVQLPSRKTAAK